MAGITSIKNNFKRGSKPTEANFSEVFDSYLNLTDGGTVAGGTTFSGALTANGLTSFGAQTVAAAGSDQAGAGAISATGGAVVIVTGADDAKGVRLPLLSAVSIGSIFFVMNNLVNKTLEIYPGSGDAVNPAADNAAITVAADTITMFICLDTAEWFGAELPVIGA